jgi:tol-pal system protein YbgF
MLISVPRYPLAFIATLLLWGVHGQAFAQQAGTGMVEMSQQLIRLEAEVRQLRGEIERLTFENKRLKSQQNDYYVDLDGRLRKLESGQQPGASVPLGSAQPASSVAPPGSLTTTSPPTGTLTTSAPVTASTTPQTLAPADPAREKAAYKDAFDQLKRGKYKEAIPAFQQFLSMYPSGEYASNAQYWLGEAHYVMREFQQAIEEFNKVITIYPQSRKVPDAMLKIGYIHYEMNDADKARQSLNTLIEKFPSTTAARLAGNRLQRMKLEGR